MVLQARFPAENRFSDGKNEANCLDHGVKPRARLKAVLGASFCGKGADRIATGGYVC